MSCEAPVAMVMVTDVIVRAVSKERKGKIVDHIEVSIFHLSSTISTGTDNKEDRIFILM